MQIPEKLQANTLDANTLDANILDANTLDANTLGANILDANTLDANTLETTSNYSRNFTFTPKSVLKLVWDALCFSHCRLSQKELWYIPTPSR